MSRMSGAFVMLQWRPWEMPDGAVAVEKICPVRSIVDNIEVRAVDAMNEDDKRCRTVCFYVAICYDKIQCL